MRSLMFVVFILTFAASALWPGVHPPAAHGHGTSVAHAEHGSQPDRVQNDAVPDRHGFPADPCPLHCLHHSFMLPAAVRLSSRPAAPLRAGEPVSFYVGPVLDGSVPPPLKA